MLTPFAPPTSDIAAQPANQKADSGDDQLLDQVDVRTVEAGEQNLTECPTHESARPLTLLLFHERSTDMSLIASLCSLKKGPHTTLAVDSQVPADPLALQDSLVDAEVHSTTLRPCAQFRALVESSEASTIQQWGGGGYTIMTRGVKDLLQDGPHSSDVELVSFCSLENLQHFRLDPPRLRVDKKQAALVLISSVPDFMTMDSLPLP